jgi:hypothetical protein
MTRSSKLDFDHLFLLHYIFYGYKHIIIRKYIWWQIQPYQIYTTKSRHLGPSRWRLSAHTTKDWSLSLLNREDIKINISFSLDRDHAEGMNADLRVRKGFFLKRNYLRPIHRP